MRNVVIAGSSSYAPERVVENAEVSRWFGHDLTEWLAENVNIRRRRWCAPEETTVDLCVGAARALCDEHGVSPDIFDLLIVATDTPEYLSPATSVVVQNRLGARAAAFDLNAACAGFVTALQTAAYFMKANPHYQNALIIGAYAISKFINQNDLKTATIFADGAGAFWLKSTPNDESENPKGFLAAKLFSDGAFFDRLGIYEGGTAFPKAEQTRLRFQKKFPKNFNVEQWTRQILELCDELNVKPNEVSRYFITQISYHSILETMQRLNLPKEKAYLIMENYGYTGAACIPMAFDDARKTGAVNAGDLVFFIGSGGGLSLASAAFRL